MTTNQDLETKFIGALKDSGIPVEMAGPILDVARKHIVEGRYSPLANQRGYYFGEDEHEPHRLLRDLRASHRELFEPGLLPATEQLAKTSLDGLEVALRDENIERGLDALRNQPWRFRR